MGVLELLTVLLFGYQVAMPAIDNGKYLMTVSPKGDLIRMNTQDGSMVHCDLVTLVCEEPRKPEPEPETEKDDNVGTT